VKRRRSRKRLSFEGRRRMQEERQRLVVVPRGMVRVEEWFGVSTKSKREHNNSLSLSCHVRE